MVLSKSLGHYPYLLTAKVVAQGRDVWLTLGSASRLHHHVSPHQHSEDFIYSPMGEVLAVHKRATGLSSATAVGHPRTRR